MKCQSCGKRKATVKYFDEINGKKNELLLCVNCAKKLGISGFNELFVPMFTSIPEYANLFSKQCKNCGYRLEDYSRTGLLGCPECYTTFESTLDELFYKIHGQNRHVKIAKRKKDTEEILNEKIGELKERLHDLVLEERYEEAAILRDEIKKLKEGN